MAIQLRPLPPEVFNEEARPYIKHLNVVLRDLCALEGTIRDPLQARRSDLSIARRNQFQVAVSRITPSISDVVSGISTVVGTPALTLGTVNTVGSTTTALSINSAIALFGTQVPAALAATAATGSSAYASRGDHVHLFPPTLRSTANASTVELTDDATDQTLTSSLGQLNIRTAADTFSLPLWTGGGKADASVGTVLSFFARTALIGTTLTTGLRSQVVYDTVAAYSSLTHRSGDFILSQANSAVGYTSETAQVLKTTFTSSSFGSNVNTWTEIDGIHNTMGCPSGANTTITDLYGYRQIGWPTIGTFGTITNVAGVRIMMPTIGSVIRRGCWVDPSSTLDPGAEATDVEGFYCGALPRGTTQRTSFYAAGIATGTPMRSASFYAEAHVVGSSRFSFYGVSDTFYQGGIAQIGGALRHEGTQIGFHGSSSIAQSTGWSASGFTASKTLNGNSFSLNELMSVTLTLITHLVNRGDLAV